MSGWDDSSRLVSSRNLVVVVVYLIYLKPSMPKSPNAVCPRGVSNPGQVHCRMFCGRRAHRMLFYGSLKRSFCFHGCGLLCLLDWRACTFNGQCIIGIVRCDSAFVFQHEKTRIKKTKTIQKYEFRFIWLRTTNFRQRKSENLTRRVRFWRWKIKQSYSLWLSEYWEWLLFEFLVRYFFVPWAINNFWKINATAKTSF